MPGAAPGVPGERLLRFLREWKPVPPRVHLRARCLRRRTLQAHHHHVVAIVAVIAIVAVVAVVAVVVAAPLSLTATAATATAATAAAAGTTISGLAAARDACRVPLLSSSLAPGLHAPGLHAPGLHAPGLGPVCVAARPSTRAFLAPRRAPASFRFAFCFLFRLPALQPPVHPHVLVPRQQLLHLYCRAGCTTRRNGAAAAAAAGGATLNGIILPRPSAGFPCAT
eukprot:815793-Prorocentrum_minimum.AAC.1